MSVTDRWALDKIREDAQTGLGSECNYRCKQILELCDRVAELEGAVEIATITMASVWPEDFRAVFSDAELLAMGRRHLPKDGTDFLVENAMREVIAKEDSDDQVER